MQMTIDGKIVDVIALDWQCGDIVDVTGCGSPHTELVVGSHGAILLKSREQITPKAPGSTVDFSLESGTKGTALVSAWGFDFDDQLWSCALDVLDSTGTI